MWQDIPPLRCLKAFDAVARYKSITRAATEENVSQSAISQSISQLEEMLRTRLLDRSLRPATLTDQGRQFHRVISDAFGQVAREVEGLRALHRSTENVLTISCNLGFATYWLMPRLSEYSLLFPDITINVMTTYQGPAELNPGVDIALRYGNGQWQDCVGELLFREILIPVCSHGFLEANEPIEGSKNIARKNLIHVDVNDPSWPNWTTYFESLKVTSMSGSKGSRFSNYGSQNKCGCRLPLMSLKPMNLLAMTPKFSIGADLLPFGRLVPFLELNVHVTIGDRARAMPSVISDVLPGSDLYII